MTPFNNRCYHLLDLAGAQEKNLIVATAVTQLVLALAGAFVAYLAGKSAFAIALLWGSAVALANTLLLLWRMARGDRPTYNAKQHLNLMYRSSVERFFVVTTFLALGLLKFKLGPLPVILGFLGGQIILMAVPIMFGINSSKRWQAKP